jgi:hypothetical protein
VFYLSGSSFGVLADCGDNALAGVVLPEPDTLTPLSNPAALAYDTESGEVLLASLGGVGTLYAYDPSDGSWTERGGLNNFDAIAGSYFSGDDKLYLASATWATSLSRFSATGVFEATVTPNPALTPNGSDHVQIRESGASLYYIQQSYGYYSFSALVPATGAVTVIAP